MLIFKLPTAPPTRPPTERPAGPPATPVQPQATPVQPRVGTITLEKDEEKTLPAGLRPWKTICHDDPVHTMDFVVILFQRLFGFSLEVALTKMYEVHYAGRSIVYTGPKEQAEYYAEQLGKAGMTNSIESA
jgi:ATP-dependent Clp protease adaptor protein ClpS